MKQWNKQLNTAYFLIITLLVFLTLARNSIWHTEYSIWKDIIIKSPDKPRPYNNLGTIAEKERLIDEAVSAYKKAIDLYKRDMLDPSPSMNARYNLGLLYLERGMKEDAVKIFRDLFSAGLGADYNDDVIESLVKRLDTLFNKTKDIHSNQTALNPESRGELYDSLGAVYLAAGLDELAAILFQKSIKYNPKNASAYNNLGAAYLKRGYLDAAIKEFEKAINMDAGLVDAYSNIGFAYFDKGDYKTALDFHLKANELNPEYANAHYGLASIYEKFGDKEKALKHWEEYVKLAPQTSWTDEAKKHIKEIKDAK